MNFHNTPLHLFSRVFQKNSVAEMAQEEQQESSSAPLSFHHSTAEKYPKSNPSPKPLISKAKYKVLLDTHKKKQIKAKLSLLKSLLEERLCDDIDLNDLARKLGMSYTSFYRFVKTVTQQTPSVFIRSFRLKKALHLLQNSTLNISEIAYEVGFKDPNYFSRAFKEEFGETPSEVRL